MMYLYFCLTIIFTCIQSTVALYIDDDGLWIGSSISGIIGLIILILDLIVIFELLKSNTCSACFKLAWILIIIFFPIGGLILYWCCARAQTVGKTI